MQFYLWDTLQYEHLTRIDRPPPAGDPRRSARSRTWPGCSRRRSCCRTRRWRRGAARSPSCATSSAPSLAAPIPHYYTPAGDRPALPPRRPAGERGTVQRPPAVRGRAERPDALRAGARGLVAGDDRRPLAPADGHSCRDGAAAAERAGARSTQRLETDLRPRLQQSAPRINLGPPPDEVRRERGRPALVRLREAGRRAGRAGGPAASAPCRRTSARRASTAPAWAAPVRSLPRRRPGRSSAVPAAARPLVYQLRPGSREVKLRAGATSTSRLACEGMPASSTEFFRRTAEGTWLEPTGRPDMRARMEDVLGVTVAALDRDAAARSPSTPSARYVRTDPDGAAWRCRTRWRRWTCRLPRATRSSIRRTTTSSPAAC